MTKHGIQIIQTSETSQVSREQISFCYHTFISDTSFIYIINHVGLYVIM